MLSVKSRNEFEDAFVEAIRVLPSDRVAGLGKDVELGAGKVRSPQAHESWRSDEIRPTGESKNGKVDSFELLVGVRCPLWLHGDALAARRLLDLEPSGCPVGVGAAITRRDLEIGNFGGLAQRLNADSSGELRDLRLVKGRLGRTSCVTRASRSSAVEPGCGPVGCGVLRPDPLRSKAMTR